MIATLLLHWALAAYQVFLDTAFVLLFGGLMQTMLDKKIPLKTALFQFRFVLITLIVAIVSYKLVFDYLKTSGYINEAHNATMLSLNEMPKRFSMATQMAFKQLIHYDFPFLPLSITYSFLPFLFIFLFLFLNLKQSFLFKFSFLFLFFLMLLSSQIHILISKTIATGPRVDFYGLLFIRVIIVIFAFKITLEWIKTKHFFQNILLVLSIFLIWNSIIQNLSAQRLHKLAFDFEMNLLNRIIDRIENHPQFNYQERYCGIVFGEVANLRTKLYPNAQKYKTPSEILHHRLITEWNPIEAFLYNMPENVFGACGKIYSAERAFLENDPQFNQMMQRLQNAGILQNLKPWPDQNSIVIFENLLIWVAQDDSLKNIQKHFQKK